MQHQLPMLVILPLAARKWHLPFSMTVVTMEAYEGASSKSCSGKAASGVAGSHSDNPVTTACGLATERRRLWGLWADQNSRKALLGGTVRYGCAWIPVS
jgi:hypothetical protein